MAAAESLRRLMASDWALIDNWLRHVQDVYQKHELAISMLTSKEAQADRLCELNVIEQVVNVCQTTVVQDAWMRGDKVTVHGWIYALKDGKLRDLGMTISSPDEMRSAYQDAVRSAK